MSEIKTTCRGTPRLIEAATMTHEEYLNLHTQGVKELRAAYEALQKENERLKIDLYGMQEAKKAHFNISKANLEECGRLLNESCDDNAIKQQAIISLKYEIDGMHDLNAAQAKRIAELEETNGLLQTQVHCLEMVAASKNGE